MELCHTYESATQVRVWVWERDIHDADLISYQATLLSVHIAMFYNIDEQHDGGMHHNLNHLEGDAYLCEVWGDVVVEPAVEDHVAQGGAHRNQVEAEEREEVQPGQGYWCIGETTRAGYESFKFHNHETLYCTLYASALQQVRGQCATPVVPLSLLNS